ncbi:sugar kinase, partial [Streptomyces albidoflavus]
MAPPAGHAAGHRARRRGGTPGPVPEDGPHRPREAEMTAAAPAAAPAVAVDAGSRYLRVARADGDGPPYLVDLPGTVPGEGLPTPDRVRGDRAAALAAACA